MLSTRFVQLLVIFVMVIVNVYSIHDGMTSGSILQGLGGNLDNGGVFYGQNSVQYQPYYGNGFFG